MKVKIKFEFTLEREWADKYANKEHIEFCLNEGTWCQSNLVDWMNDAAKKSERQCLCGMVKATFVEPVEERDSATQIAYDLYPSSARPVNPGTNLT